MFTSIIFLATAISTALIAGLMFAWSYSVTPGLAVIGDREYLTAFQAMNRAILNPVFKVCFIAPALLLPFYAWLQKDHSPLRLWLIAAAALLYIAGVIGVTFGGNVPINEKLNAFDIAKASAQEISSLRKYFEPHWNQWHTVRTLTSFLSLFCLMVAMLVQHEK